MKNEKNEKLFSFSFLISAFGLSLSFNINWHLTVECIYSLAACYAYKTFGNSVNLIYKLSIFECVLFFSLFLLLLLLLLLLLHFLHFLLIQSPAAILQKFILISISIIIIAHKPSFCVLCSLSFSWQVCVMSYVYTQLHIFDVHLAHRWQ